MDNVSIMLLCSLIACVVGFLSYIRAGKKETKEEAACTTRTEAKLDYVIKGVDDIRLDMRDHGRKIDNMNERLTRTEESTKSAHHRLDEHVKEGE